MHCLIYQSAINLLIEYQWGYVVTIHRLSTDILMDIDAFID